MRGKKLSGEQAKRLSRHTDPAHLRSASTSPRDCMSSDQDREYIECAHSLDCEPCLFCGELDTTGISYSFSQLAWQEKRLQPRDFHFFVECSDCGASGPIHEMPMEAFSSWNRPLEATRGGDVYVVEFWDKRFPEDHEIDSVWSTKASADGRLAAIESRPRAVGEDGSVERFALDEAGGEDE